MAIATLLNQETKLQGSLLVSLSAEASTTSFTASFFEVRTNSANVARTPNATTLVFAIDPENTLGQGTEIIKVASHATSSGITTLTTVVRGLLLTGGYALTGSATRAKSWPTGTPIGVATNHYPINMVNAILNGTIGTGSANLRIGTETDVNTTIYIQNSDTNKPFIQYDATNSEWLISDDGTSTYDPKDGTGGLSAGTNVGIAASVISVPNANGTMIWDQTKVTDNALKITRNLASTSTDSALIEFENTNASDDQSVLLIDQNADAIGLDIDSESATAASYGLRVVTGQGADVALFQDTASSTITIHEGGSASGFLDILRDLASADTSGPVVTITQDNSGDDQAGLKIQQDAVDAPAINIVQGSADIDILTSTSAASGGADGDVWIRQATTNTKIQQNINGTWKNVGQGPIVGAFTKVGDAYNAAENLDETITLPSGMTAGKIILRCYARSYASTDSIEYDLTFMWSGLTLISNIYHYGVPGAINGLYGTFSSSNPTISGSGTNQRNILITVNSITAGDGNDVTIRCAFSIVGSPGTNSSIVICQYIIYPA